MTIRNIIFCCFSFIFLAAFSQSENDILSIRIRVEKVNTESASYYVAPLENHETSSTEANEILFYSNKNSIQLIKETYFGETGKTIIWNYIENNSAYFIFKEYFTYKLPISDKKFDGTVFSKKEERFYIKNNRIIKWMQGKKVVTKYPKNAASIENNMILHIEDMIAKFDLQTK
jgi:hypothetical protein